MSLRRRYESQKKQIAAIKGQLDRVTKERDLYNERCDELRVENAHLKEQVAAFEKLKHGRL